MSENRVRHIVSLSGGKDSTALAIHLREQIPNVEYVFSDTDKELPETYEYLDRVEAYLGTKIVRLRSEYSFDHWLEVYSGFLPSPRMRWCTKMLKIRPFEIYIGDDEANLYIGIRADENRGGYQPYKTNIHPVYPFVKEGMTIADIHSILERSGIGFPAYYSWRSRSGCFFCFFQQKREWLGLREHHPNLFEKAKWYEEEFARKKRDEAGIGKADNKQRHTWNDDEYLRDLERPERARKIIDRYQEQLAVATKHSKSSKLIDILAGVGEDDQPQPCSFCHI
jgi:3'-phosphoadenosine 5'-phosphosulfate sulfotransferase (PAPS reductase)/FAD synthetase